MKKAINTIFHTFFVLSICGCMFFRSSTSVYLTEAERYAQEGEIELAIASYQKHINQRLEDPKRPTWENPYFYFLLIGDLTLAQGKVLEAEAKFLEAESHGVDKETIDDRLRTLATYYEKRGDSQKALDVLIKYRERDPILFDSMADRIAKEMSL